MIANWWNNMSLTQQIFALFATPATVVLVIQTILLLVGLGTQGGSETGTDSQADGDFSDAPDTEAAVDPGLRLFTVRGLVAFFAIGGWVGIALIDLNVHVVLASFLALAAGFMALALVAWIVKIALGLQSTGNLDVRNAIGLTGRVYLSIPGGGRYSGKVSLLLQERAVELDAITDDSVDIPTGSQIKVIGLRGTLLVVVPDHHKSEKGNESDIT
ncbi:MAG: hypothetical protein SCM11_07905 [Bacillota bacterium]|nr:hypothetical protein [Bacillota bacterium]